MSEFIRSCTLLLVVLNPFALSVYLIEVFKGCSLGDVTRVLFRASLISGAIFAIFAYAGQAVFTEVLQVRFAAFQVFGGVLFLVVALRFMLSGGTQALVSMRGEPEHIAGAVAMPFLIGPGSFSAATMTGMRLTPIVAVSRDFRIRASKVGRVQNGTELFGLLTLCENRKWMKCAVLIRYNVAMTTARFVEAVNGAVIFVK